MVGIVNLKNFYSKSAITKVQAAIIAVIIVFSTVATVYYITLLLSSPSPNPTPTPTQTPPSTFYVNVTVTQAKSLIDLNPSLVILDVRTKSEYYVGHLINAKLIPHTELEDRLDELNKTDEILVYCRTDRRSNIAAQILVDYGFQHVCNMLGGITVWINEGYPIEPRPTPSPQVGIFYYVGMTLLIPFHGNTQKSATLPF